MIIKFAKGKVLGHMDNQFLTYSTLKNNKNNMHLSQLSKHFLLKKIEYMLYIYISIYLYLPVYI